MHRYGLALSGGGFRAALYHLGVVRYLRDAGILHNISQITSVSGGSVFGAHLVLNWERYCGTDEEFQRVSDELIQFLQMDVRNRIVRRFPLASVVNWGRRTLRLNTWRQYTRAGLLEQHYEKFLYGDRGLFSLPESPRLYILATDLSEGSLCAFYRDGLLLQRRTPGGHDQFEKLQVGLATVPMAVAASSAFPGFFPPLELRGSEVGAKEGEFARHAFTDGGIYDNLGLRMFRHLKLSSIRDAAEFSVDDVLDRDATIETLVRGAEMPNDSALGNLWHRLESVSTTTRPASTVQERARDAIDDLGEVLQSETLYLEPAFGEVKLQSERAQSLLDEMRSSENAPELSDVLWVNQQLVAALLQKEAGKPCLRSSSDGIDGIFVSNAGASFKVRSEGRAGGLMATAMRSSDILMDRVNQMELESFYKTSGVLFFPITQVIEESQDPFAPHREVQRQAALIRTDMDRFTDLEVSALVQHGYCIARHQCSDLPELSFKNEVNGPPWNPLAMRDAARGSSRAVAALSDEDHALESSRVLQKSASRRIFSTLLSWKDWPSYIWAPLFLTIICTLPYMLYQSKQTALHQSHVLAVVAETSPLYRKILNLLDSGPIHELPDVPFEEVEQLDSVAYEGVEVISDDRIYDLRGWSAAEGQQWSPYSYTRVRMRRLPDSAMYDDIRMQLATNAADLQFRCRNTELHPRFFRTRQDGRYLWELRLDLTRVAVGEERVMTFESILPSDMAEQIGNVGRFRFTIGADTGFAQIWMLMPSDRAYDKFEIWSYPIGNPEMSELVIPAKTVNLPIGSIATFQLINPKADRRYECRWRWSGIEE